MGMRSSLGMMPPQGAGRSSYNRSGFLLTGNRERLLVMLLAMAASNSISAERKATSVARSDLTARSNKFASCPFFAIYPARRPASPPAFSQGSPTSFSISGRSASSSLNGVSSATPFPIANVKSSLSGRFSV